MKSGGGGGGSSSGGGSFGGINYDDILRRSQEIFNKAIEPSVAALNASKGPLKDRYNNLLNTIKNNQTTAENRQTVTTSGELGKRGLSADSTLSQQELTNALNPITQQYTGLSSDATAEQGRESAAIDAAIANLYTGASQGAVSNASNLYGTQLNQQQAERELAERARQFNESQAFQREQTNRVSASDNAYADYLRRLDADQTKQTSTTAQTESPSVDNYDEYANKYKSAVPSTLNNFNYSAFKKPAITTALGIASPALGSAYNVGSNIYNSARTLYNQNKGSVSNIYKNIRSRF